jgi:hypothetical protein
MLIRAIIIYDKKVGLVLQGGGALGQPASGVPCAMLGIVYDSITLSPARLRQTWRGNPSTVSVSVGSSFRPCTSVHCLTI